MAREDLHCRAGADIGGTFTDVVLDVRGELHSAKVLTDYEAPERAIFEGLRLVTAAAGVCLADIDLLVHGTTLATNALIERRGAKTALITTEGFRDVIEMQTESRFDQYDLDIVLPLPLIERAHRLTLRERMDAQGCVLVAPRAADVDRLVALVRDGGYESVAIGFLHAYVNDEHERLVRDRFAAALPDLSVSISAEVSPQMREYERINTVCANAYVRPAIASYLGRLVSELTEIGARCPVFLMHSGGGIISVADAVRFPVRLIESGPAGGAIFAADMSRRHGLGKVLSFDMGGTTAKICLIENHTSKTTNVFEVARQSRFRKGSGMPISIPVIEMIEIGAGGGSIASVDDLRQIRVGPQSAGSEPGPASYARGGIRPTVTDADLLLGRLDPLNFAGGTMPLSLPAAASAICASVGLALAFDEVTAAFGICEVVDENMANAGRVHAIENGKDLADFSMITFGGAGPLHAARLCEKMGIGSFLVPPGAGVGSAIGFLRAPFGYEAVRSLVVRLADLDPDVGNRLLQSMAEEASGFIAGRHAEEAPVVRRVACMRYAGQGWDIPVVLPDEPFGAGMSARLRALFEEAYVRVFGRPIEGLDLEIVSWSVRVSSPPRPVVPVAPVLERASVAAETFRLVFDPSSRAFIQTGIHERARLKPGDRVRGPALIVEPETTTVLTSAFDAIIQTDGSIFGLNRTLSTAP